MYYIKQCSDGTIMNKYSGNILEAIPRLPPDLQRVIYETIDIDTRLAFLLDGNLTLSRGNQRRVNREMLYNGDNHLLGWLLEQQDGWFTEQEFSVIYKHGYLCKLFQYDNRQRRWKIKTDFVDMLPKTTFYGYPESTLLNLFEETSLLTFRHPVFDMIETLRLQDIGLTSNRVCLSLSLMINTNVFDINFNYYIRKLAFNMLVAMNIYKRTCIKSREIREIQRLQNEVEKERIRAERCAMRKIEIEEERNRRITERDMERQRVIQEREIERQRVIQEREIERQRVIQERDIERQRIIQERINAIRIKEERKMTLQREKEERRLVKMEQTAKKRQEKVLKTEEKLKRANILAIKRELLRQKQVDKCENQILHYISKLFK
jgi:hypothetical protein